MDNMTLEEALAAADVSTTPVNDILMVDAEARTIIVPASEMLFGVRQDMDAERKHFKCPKIVGDNVDLSNCHIYISYVPSKQDGTYDINEDVGAYLCEDLDVDGDYVTFSWKLSGNVFVKAGYIAFAVYAKQADADGNLQTKWHTTFAIGKVLDTLPDGEQIVEKYADVIEQLLNRMDEVEALATPEAMQNYVEAYLAEHPAELDETLTDNTKAAPAGMVGEMKEEISSLSEEIANIKQNGSGTGSGKTAIDTFMDNIDVDYAYDSTTGANYTLVRIYKNKIDGTKQYPFVYAPNGAGAGTKSTYDMNYEKGFVFAINSGVFNTSTKKPDGIVIQNGVVVQSGETTTHSQCKPLTIDSNGDLSYAEYNADADELVANGIVSCVCGFIPIIIDYNAVDSSEWNSVSHYTQNTQRQIIGQFGNGDYAVLTCEGRSYDNSDGWTIAEAQTICQKHGLKFAYNLDGGGSTETMLGLKHINTIYENATGRIVPTFIVFNGKDTFGDVPDTPEVTLSSISATYNGGNVTVGTSVSDLTGITVTAHYSDGSTANVTGYALSGTITEGNNTITVSYGGKTTTFIVTGILDSTAYEVIRQKAITMYTGIGYGTVSQNSGSRMTALSTQNVPKLKYENGGTLTGETSDYAPIELSNNATTISITCDGCTPAVTLWTTDGEKWTRTFDPGWMSANGGTYILPTDGEYTHYAVNFKPNSGNIFDSTVDESKFSIVVE